jgi:hypothetical protein
MFFVNLSVGYRPGAVIQNRDFYRNHLLQASANRLIPDDSLTCSLVFGVSQVVLTQQVITKVSTRLTIDRVDVI